MDASLTLAGVLALLGLGLVFGLKHATEVDHVVAVSTIVSQNRNLLRSALVGALWGAGHTAALLVTGAIVLWLRVTIPENVSNWLEFGVALMIFGLGASALWRALRKGREVHLHKHSHDGVSHVHVHFHEPTTRHDQDHSSPHTHAVHAIGSQTSVGWDDARPRRIGSHNTSRLDSNQIGLVGDALSRNLWSWLDRRHAADVRLDRIAFCLELAKPIRTESSFTGCCGRTKHRFRIVVCVPDRSGFRALLAARSVFTSSSLKPFFIRNHHE